MANIKKSFNFRDGVQVDDDNLKVSTTGLVGIGTTVPTESLDVRGNLVVSGVSSATVAQAGVMTVTTLNPTEIIGAGVSIVSGIVTASSGIITFYGDARFLQGMPTSQWEDVNTGLGVSSIYNTGGNVGIATSNPQFTLQIGSNVNLSQNGVGISSAGDIKISGVATATKFVGALTGDVIGNVTGNLTGNVSADVNSSGVSTFSDLIVNRNLNVSGLSTFTGITSVTGPVFHSTQLDISGISTMRGGISIPFSNGQENLQIGFVKNNLIDVTGIASIGTRFGNQDLHLSAGGVNPDSGRGVKIHSDAYLLKQLDVSGAAVFRNQLSIQSAAGLNLTNGGSIISDGDIRSANKVVGDDGVESDMIAMGRATVFGVVGHPRMIHTIQDGPLILAGHQGSGVEIHDVFTCNGNLQGQANIIADSSTGKIGVGTDNPVNDIQVRKSGNTEVQVTSDTGSASLTVGREAGTNNTNNAEFRYGLVSGGSPYSSAQSLDILNYGTGNFNYHISANNPNAIAGDFHWHKGLNSTRLMTLTGIGGSLGIGNTQPSTKLDVGGGGKFTGDLEVTNNLTLGGSLTISAISANVTGNLTGNVTGNVTGLINSPVTGVSTITNLEITSVGIGTTSNGNFVNISSNANQKIIINNDSQVGIFTDTFDDSNVGVAINRNLHIKKAVSVGSTTRSAVDFSNAVNISNEGETGLPFNRSQLAYMIPPRVTTTQRNLLRDAYTNSATLISGAMVYNTTSKRIEVYIDGGWVGLATVA